MMSPGAGLQRCAASINSNIVIPQPLRQIANIVSAIRRNRNTTISL